MKGGRLSVAVPVITLTPDRESYLPGHPVAVVVTAVDPDSSTERLSVTGIDSQDNAVTVTIDIDRRDIFLITSAVWDRTGQALTIDNSIGRVTGIIPGV